MLVFINICFAENYFFFVVMTFLLQAGQSFCMGEVVISEKAYAAVLNFDHHLTYCSYCFRKTSALIPYANTPFLSSLL